MDVKTFERNILQVKNAKDLNRKDHAREPTPQEVGGPLGQVMQKHNLTLARAVELWEAFGG